jgi:hypothetical protein
VFSRPLSERYRCPEYFCDFALRGKLSSDKGYFRLGPSITCYGRTCSGFRHPHVDSSLYDVLQEVVASDARVQLPFDPGEIIENLRLERYKNGDADGNYSTSSLKSLYYFLRPLTNLSVRKYIQKFYSRNWRERSFPHWPVDTTVEDICEKLLWLAMEAKGIKEVPFVWFWPKGARGCITMTHDVETEAGRDFCAALLDLDDDFGIKASFQLVPEGRYAWSPELLDAIRSRGFDYGIQDLNHDGRLFDSRETFLRRVEIINRYGAQYSANGFRAGVLYRRPEWYDRLKFSFDMSMPNVAHSDPQRGGCCTVMPYFIGDILELPVTTTQDYTLFYLLNDRSIDLWKTQTDLILSKNGFVSFIVHPDYVIDPENRDVYRRLLAYLKQLHDEHHVWVALPAEVDSWWRARSQMSIEKNGDSWRIVGEGSDRAVLAFARKADHGLFYEITTAD